MSQSARGIQNRTVREQKTEPVTYGKNSSFETPTFSMIPFGRLFLKNLPFFQ
jgi:hypothetical protein